MAGAIPAWALLAHDSWKESAVGILGGILWMHSSDNVRGARYRYIFYLLRVGPAPIMYYANYWLRLCYTEAPHQIDSLRSAVLTEGQYRWISNSMRAGGPNKHPSM